MMSKLDYSSTRAEITEGLYANGITLEGTACRCPDPNHPDDNPSAGIFLGKDD